MTERQEILRQRVVAFAKARKDYARADLALIEARKAQHEAQNLLNLALCQLEEAAYAAGIEEAEDQAIGTKP